MQALDLLGIKRLLYFRQIASSRSFRDAARVLGVAQPALTRYVQSLENELGVVLIHRRATGNTLTEAGQILASRTDELLTTMSSLKSDLDGLREDVAGTVTLGLSMGFAKLFLAPFLSNFPTKFPHVHLRIMEGSTRHVEEWLHNDQADVGLICLPSGLNQRVEESLIREELHLITSNPDGRVGSIVFAELAERELVLPLPRYGTRQLLDKMASEASVTLRPVMEADNPDTIRHLVLTTGWSTVHSVRLFEREIASGAVAAIPINPAPVRHIVLITSTDKPLSSATRATARAIGEALRPRQGILRADRSARSDDRRPIELLGGPRNSTGNDCVELSG